MTTTYLELIEGNSANFWEAEIDGDVVILRWGKLGAARQTKTKKFDSFKAAARAAEKMVSDKLKRGYQPSANAASVAKIDALRRVTGKSVWSQNVTKKWRQLKLSGFPFRHFRKKFAGYKLRKSLVRALNEMDSGILVLQKLQGIDELLALLAHPKAKSVKEIRFESWSDKARIEKFSTYRRNERGFKREVGLDMVELPVFILDVTYFFNEILIPRKTGVEVRGYDALNNNGLEHVGTSSPASAMLVSAEAPRSFQVRKFLLSNRYGFSDFNYFPLACYGADNVTWGIYFDFKEGRFVNSLGLSEDGFVGSYWEALTRSMEGYLDELEEELESADPDEVEVEIEMASYWFYGRILLGYLRHFGALKVEPRRQYGFLRMQDASGESFLFGDEPRFKVKLSTDSLEYIGSLSDSVVSIFDAAVQAVTLQSEESLASVARALDESIDQSDFLKDLANVIRRSSDDDRLAALLEVSSTLCAVGCPWLVLSACIQAWREAESTVASRRITQVLDVVPNDYCPQFIKKTAQLHAETRYDPDIITW